ncbi:carbamoyltransferase [Aliiroseovarius subalbicans]|uniref:carbamoyltransferase family protein n=1 Tax=Aliiroseovarius subalbicans TaxID=2925840 RepID=UPI001F591EEA|nr:carbamoyltransferase [Aliiroseovarius subalbicans]MCI2397769.1 carbamoyltransferase [Aliiroseovarius subalbicans]
MAAILGISAFYHDSAAALLVDGEIIAAAQEERFTRQKHTPDYPRQAIDYCLAEAGLKMADLDQVVFYDKPFLKFERLLETYASFAPRGFASFRKAVPVWIKDKLFQKTHLLEELNQHDGGMDGKTELLFSEHHLSHAASAFYPSPFDEALVLTLDGVGERATTAVFLGKGNQLTPLREINFPHSLGLLYSAFTYYLGFKVNSGEYKIMGLAPYGEPRFVDLILDKLVDLKPDGSFRLDQRYFNYATGLTMTNRRFADLFGQPRREPETEDLAQFHMDMAASVQAVTERIVLALVQDLAREFDTRNLCLAGGVALNCVANGKVLRDGAFDRIWIQPASGDAGCALGAAQVAWHMEQDQPRLPQADRPGGDGMKGSYLGPEFEQADIETRLRAAGAEFHVLAPAALSDRAATDLAEGKAVGWFQGRMEFGPRALGGRSILGDPRSPTMQKTLNLKVKYRESFRPFAPSVLKERVSEYFDLNEPSPYMLIVADVQKARRKQMSEADQALFGIDKLNVQRSDIPAITHVDYSARVQSVDHETNPRYHDLISRFEEKTGCAVLINTSFNVRGEPIVCTPEDAFHCFMGTDMDTLAVGNCYLVKGEQDPALAEDYTSKYALD